MNLSKNYIISISFLIVITCVSLIFSLNLTSFNFTYALDDPYIHMSTVKHLVAQGIWSVDGETYASASSSPLYIFILAPFYLILGSNIFVYVPFAINLIFQVLTVNVVFSIIKKHTHQEIHYVYAFILILFTPFIPLAFGGMEHSIQIFLVTLLLYVFLDYIDNPIDTRLYWKLVLLPALVGFIRYEDLALIFAISLVIAFYFRNWKLALAVLTSGLSLIIIFGIWTKYAMGLGFVPSSIMAKSMLGNETGLLPLLKSIINKFFKNFYEPHIIVLYILNVFIFVKSFNQKNTHLFLLSIVFLLTLFAHLAFAGLGWLYRYEAYLLVFAFVNIFIYLYTYHYKSIKRSYIILLIIILLPIFIKQMLHGPYLAIFMSKNIYEQQIQMSNFLKKECNDCHIAANDIGAITYFTNIKLLDLYGLGNYEVIEHKKHGTYTTYIQQELLKKNDISLIMVYDNWFPNSSFSNYEKIASWKIPKILISGGDTVSFYSRKDSLDINQEKINKFSKNFLPKDVTINLLGDKK